LLECGEGSVMASGGTEGGVSGWLVMTRWLGGGRRWLCCELGAIAVRVRGRNKSFFSFLFL